MTASKPRVRKPPIERFTALVFKDTTTGCWRWLGAKFENGYGVFSGGEHRRAHRWSYEWFVGPIPDGYEIDHLCRVRDCVNPAHLEAVTPRENTRRSTSPAGLNARKTHCSQGHPFDEGNTVLVVRCRGGRHETYRRCLICRREQSREYEVRRRQRRSAS